MDEQREDKIISDFLQSLGPWSRRVIIGGGYAPIIYKMYLSDEKITNSPMATRDIDSLISRRLLNASQTSISDHLKSAGFVQKYKDLENPPTEFYKKNVDGVEVEVEFLTDQSTRIEKYKNVFISGVVAQPLKYLDLSLRTHREFKTFAGLSGRVVSPGAWMLHKALTFPQRHTEEKQLKDLYGIWYVGSALKDLSNEAIKEFHNLAVERPKLFKRIQNNLGEWSERASPMVWNKLLQQDLGGQLTRKGFEILASQLADRNLAMKNSRISQEMER